MEKVKIPAEVLDALERGVIHAIQDRIYNDPDVADTFLRITLNDNRFTVRVLYIEESNADRPNNDVPLLNLMTDTNNCPDHENWIPDIDAIHEHVQSFSEVIEMCFCQN